MNTSFLRITTQLLACFCVAALVGNGAQARPQGYEGYRVVQVTITDEAELQTLRELQELGHDFQVWSEGIGIGPIDVRVAPAARPALDASGLCYEVTIQDLQQHIDDLYSAPRGGGFFDSLRTYEEHVEFMTGLVEAYPDLTEMITLGLSVEGRTLWALHITGSGENKPSVMYHGAQHGNEQAGASVVAYTAHHLLTHYGTDPQIATLVDNVEWFLLPIMNPDGYVRFDRHNANGYDLNRNWGGPGSNPNPFSQPETAALRDFFLSHANVRVHLDVHGYVPWIIWPWGHTPDYCRDHWTFHLLGSEVHDRIEAAGGRDYTIGTVWDVAYPVYGGSTNYTYGELGQWALTFELVHSQVPRICVEFLSSMLFLAEWVYDCNGNGVADADEALSDCNANNTPDECEPVWRDDFDGDGLTNACDPDIDNDAVFNEADVCDFTPPGTPVTSDGIAISDLDADCDVDLSDYWGFAHRCLRGPNTPPPLESCTDAFDYDGDLDVDLEDYSGFQRAFTGANPWDRRRG